MQHSNDTKFDVAFFCLDFDSCADTRKAQQDIIDFVCDVLQKNPECQKVMVGIGSLRQFVITDFHNAHQYYEDNGSQYISCSMLGKEFMVQLKRAIADRMHTSVCVEFLNLLAGDVYHNLPQGTHFSNMNPELYQQWRQTRGPVTLPVMTHKKCIVSDLNDEDYATWLEAFQRCSTSLPHAREERDISLAEIYDYNEWRAERRSIPPQHVLNRKNKSVPIFEWVCHQKFSSGGSIDFEDESKILTSWMFMQELKLHHVAPGHALRFYFLDDRFEDMLCDQATYFARYPFLFPEKCSFVGHQMDSFDDISPLKGGASTAIVHGAGKVFENYQNMMRKIERDLAKPDYLSLKDVKGLLLQSYRQEEETSIRARILHRRNRFVTSSLTTQSRPKSDNLSVGSELLCKEKIDINSGLVVAMGDILIDIATSVPPLTTLDILQRHSESATEDELTAIMSIHPSEVADHTTSASTIDSQGPSPTM